MEVRANKTETEMKLAKGITENKIKMVQMVVTGKKILEMDMAKAEVKNKMLSYLKFIKGNNSCVRH